MTYEKPEVVVSMKTAECQGGTTPSGRCDGGQAPRGGCTGGLGPR